MTSILAVTPGLPPERGGIQLLAHQTLANLGDLDIAVVTPRGAPPPGARLIRSPDLADQRARMAALNATAMVAGLRVRPDAVLSFHLVAAPAAAALRRVLGVPVLQWIYAKEIPSRPRLARFAARRADAVIAISSYTAGLAVELGAEPGRVWSIAPGVDVLGWRPREAPDPLCVTVSRLDDPHKGHDVLITAMPAILDACPAARLVVIGDGRLRGELQRQAVQRGVAHAITFIGAVDNETRDRWLARARVFAMPSRTDPTAPSGDAFGIVYLEAAAHGVPSVAGDRGGAVDAVQDGVTGLLIDAADPAAVAAATLALLTDDQRWAQMSRDARAHAEHCSWQASGARVREALLTVLEGDRR